MKLHLTDLLLYKSSLTTTNSELVSLVLSDVGSAIQA